MHRRGCFRLNATAAAAKSASLMARSSNAYPEGSIRVTVSSLTSRMIRSTAATSAFTFSNCDNDAAALLRHHVTADSSTNIHFKNHSYMFYAGIHRDNLNERQIGFLKETRRLSAGFHVNTEAPPPVRSSLSIHQSTLCINLYHPVRCRPAKRSRRIDRR